MQRLPLTNVAHSKMIQQAKGTENKKDVEDFKQLVSEELTPYASAILLDLEYGTPAIKARHEGSGLLTSYEKQDMTQLLLVNFLI